jgi:hypothetical protein
VNSFFTIRRYIRKRKGKTTEEDEGKDNDENKNGEKKDKE